MCTMCSRMARNPPEPNPTPHPRPFEAPGDRSKSIGGPVQLVGLTEHNPEPSCGPQIHTDGTSDPDIEEI